MKYLDGKLDENIYNVIEGYNVYNAVAMIIVCALIDEFEQRVYAIEDIDGYTLADFQAIMNDVCEPYGGTAIIKSQVTDIQEYWLSVCPNSPVYYISYATSSIAALTIHTTAQSDEALARETYRKLIEEIEEDDGFKTVLEKIGLASPFEEDTFKKLQEDLMK